MHIAGPGVSLEDDFTFANVAKSQESRRLRIGFDAVAVSVSVSVSLCLTLQGR